MHVHLLFVCLFFIWLISNACVFWYYLCSTVFRKKINHNPIKHAPGHACKRRKNQNCSHLRLCSWSNISRLLLRYNSQRKLVWKSLLRTKFIKYQIWIQSNFLMGPMILRWKRIPIFWSHQDHGDIFSYLQCPFLWLE